MGRHRLRQGRMVLQAGPRVEVGHRCGRCRSTSQTTRTLRHVASSQRTDFEHNLKRRRRATCSRPTRRTRRPPEQDAESEGEKRAADNTPQSTSVKKAKMLQRNNTE